MTGPDCFLNFPNEKIASLVQILDLPPDEGAAVAAWISGAMLANSKMEAARTRVNNVRAAKRKLNKISTDAARLAVALANEPLAVDLIANPPVDCVLDDAGVIDVWATMEGRRKFISGLVDVLTGVSLRAADLSEDDQRFRAKHFIPSPTDAGKTTPAIVLWPNLFQVWMWTGHKLAKTEGGPLHRFVSFVHEAFGLPAVPASTLKDAVLAWEQGGGLSEFGKDPPWRTFAED